MAEYYSVIGKHPSWNTEWTVHNYTLLAAALKGAGLTDSAVAAIFGNIAIEAGTFNPGQIEIEDIGNEVRGGVGFIQWTTPGGVNKLYARYGSPGWANGTYQEQMLIAEMVGDEEGYSPTDAYPITREQFCSFSGTSEANIRELAQAYRANRERGNPSTAVEDWAVYYYKIITGIDPGPGPHPQPVDNRPFLKKKQNYRRRNNYIMRYYK